MKKVTGWTVALIFTISGISLLGHDVYMSAKAVAAGRLIESAWQAHRQDGQVHHPWQWADFSPIGQLEMARLGIRRTVLSDASGASMAFGLGHVSGTARPGERGNIVLAGHRDSHAEFLSNINQGDFFILHHPGGSITYLITNAEVVPANDTGALYQGGPDRLTIVTCFPFGGLTPTDERYVLTGLRVCRQSDESAEQEAASTMAVMMSF